MVRKGGKAAGGSLNRLNLLEKKKKKRKKTA